MAIYRKKSYRPRRKIVRRRRVKKQSLAKRVKAIVTKMAEKKRVTYSNAASPLSVGQVDGLNTAGFFIQDMSPTVSQSAGNSGRVGSEISITSAYLKFQFYQMQSVFCNVKLKYQLVYIPNVCESNITLIAQQLYQNNPFNSIIDYNSSRNPDYMRSYKILRTGYCTLPNDPGSVTSQNMIIERQLGLKFKKPLRYRFPGNTNGTAEGRIIMLVFANNGNKNGTTACTLNVPVGAINTGVYFNYMLDFYYTDV